MGDRPTFFGFDKPFIPVVLGLILLVVVTFFLFPGFYKALWVFLVGWQLWALQWIDPRSSVRDGAQMTYQFIQARDAENLSFEQIILISMDVLQFSILSMCGALFFVVMAYLIWTKDRFDKALTLEDLIRSQRGLWPHLEFISRVDPTKFSGEKGPFAERMKPIEYAVQYNLVENFKSKDASKRVIRFDDLRQRLTRDLGERFTSIDQMPVIRQAMIAVAMLHLHTKVDKHGFRPELDDLLRFLNRNYARVGWIKDVAKREKLFQITRNRIAPILERHKDDRYLKDATTKHAFELTVIMRIIQQVNMYGKLTTPRYPFLFPWDRKLFFALHEMDYHESPDLDKKRIRREPKRGASVEAAAAKAHYVAELWVKGRALPEPHIKMAVDAFVNYMVDNSVITPPKGYSEAESAVMVLEDAWKKHNATAAHAKIKGGSVRSAMDAQEQDMPNSMPDDTAGIDNFY